MTNYGGKYGGTISAAAFIEKYINKDVSWIHFDIAGAAYASKEKNYIPVNATGCGVRLLVEYLKKNKFK